MINGHQGDSESVLAIAVTCGAYNLAQRAWFDHRHFLDNVVALGCDLSSSEP